MGACASSSSPGVPTPSPPGAQTCPSGGAAAPSSSKAARDRPCRNSVRDQYALDTETMGEGTFGVVHRGVHKATGATRAVKMIPMGKLGSMASFRREVSIMKSLEHPNIVRLHDTYEETECVYLAMELCRGGELFDRIIALGHLSERQAARVMKDILSAVGHLHHKGIVHRDLKPENFLFASQQPIEHNVLKVVDFGTARHCGPTTVMTSLVGTRFYVAPQVLARRYCRKCDIWSCGAILYTLLTGKPPFSGRTDQEVLAKVRQGRYSLEGKEWASVSEDAKRLIRMTMHMNSRARYSAQQASEHAWVRRCSLGVENYSPADCLIEHFRSVQHRSRSTKKALQAFAAHLHDDHISRLRDAFAAIDASGDCMLTIDEVQMAMSTTELWELRFRMDRALKGIDVDPSSMIDYTDFLAASLDRSASFTEREMRSAFNSFDIDGNGEISCEELSTVLRQSGRLELAKNVAKSMDGLGDGPLVYEDFKAMMIKASRSRIPTKPCSATSASPSCRKLSDGSLSDMETQWNDSSVNSSCTGSSSECSTSGASVTFAASQVSAHASAV
mmetsp:Transcript_109821/g.307056  ORF Transcript_109821/g.307056 Transcript_109821/m.307056 type:complete len:560 (+) Transcript_109821:96-1775(+)